MVKVKEGIATREPIPDFLNGLAPESLANLSWTDPSLSVQDCAWWPEENADIELVANKKWGAEVLTPVPERKVVQVSHEQIDMTAGEITERDTAIQAATTAVFEQSVQNLLDSAAKASGYDSISTVVSYAEETAVPKFQEDGKRFRSWRSLVWAYAYEQLALVNSGGRTQPTITEFLAELPILATAA